MLLDPIAASVLPYKFSIDQQRAAWLMDSNFKVDISKHPVWKAVTLIEEDKNNSA